MALLGYRYHGSLLAKKMFVVGLLFAMCIQNALVSIISGSLVSTAHLTGTFTDLCIELAQVLQKSNTDRPLLKSRIRLRLAIIFFFMCGPFGGAYLFRSC
ncbi:uncharacterized membrane protein YoaK (UPF0700 family) [Mucilaginibacter sp. SG564]|nr:uncharacterized membrane protein YoaK (UPF0700 family) [Mucilaginibacter sp. SG564]